MKQTEQLVERIKPRLSEVRNEKLDFLWQDFLGAVEKVVNKLTDEELAATSWITIIYKINKGDDNVYRSKEAGLDWCEELIQYEEKDTSLGKKNMLERTLKDFRQKAISDEYCLHDYFMPEYLFENDDDETTTLDFLVNRIEIQQKTSEQSKYKIVSE